MILTGTTIRPTTGRRWRSPSHGAIAHQPQQPHEYQYGDNHPEHRILLSLGHGFAAGWCPRRQPAMINETPCSCPPWPFRPSHLLLSVATFFGRCLLIYYAVGRSFVMGCNPTSDYWVRRGLPNGQMVAPGRWDLDKQFPIQGGKSQTYCDSIPRCNRRRSHPCGGVTSL